MSFRIICRPQNPYYPEYVTNIKQSIKIISNEGPHKTFTILLGAAPLHLIEITLQSHQTIFCRLIRDGRQFSTQLNLNSLSPYVVKKFRDCTRNSCQGQGNAQQNFPAFLSSVQQEIPERTNKRMETISNSTEDNFENPQLK